MKRYFKPVDNNWGESYLGTILTKESITDIYSSRPDITLNGDWTPNVDLFVKLRSLQEIPKEEAALLFGFV